MTAPILTWNHVNPGFGWITSVIVRLDPETSPGEMILVPSRGHRRILAGAEPGLIVKQDCLSIKADWREDASTSPLFVFTQQPVLMHAEDALLRLGPEDYFDAMIWGVGTGPDGVSRHKMLRSFQGIRFA